MAQLAELRATVHAITGTVFEAGEEPGTATGRVSCFAHHVVEHRGVPLDLVWAVTYRDRYRRTEAGWRFAARSASVTFTERRELQAATQQIRAQPVSQTS